MPSKKQKSDSARKMKDLAAKAEQVKGGLNKYAAWGKEPTPARPAGLGAITRQGFNSN